MKKHIHILFSMMLIVLSIVTYIPVVYANDLEEETASYDVSGKQGAASDEVFTKPDEEFTIQSSNGKTVLFITNSSSNENSINSTNYNGYSNFAADIKKKGYTVQQSTLSSTVLNNILIYDIVIFHIHSFSSISENDLKKIQQYVLNGGSLLLLGNLHTSTISGLENINDVATRFGINFVPGLLVQQSNSHQNNGIGVVVTNLETSPITKDLSNIFLNWGSVLQVQPPAVSLANTNDDAWLERNAVWSYWRGQWSYTKDSRDIDGPFSVLASSEFGRGKVIAIADGDQFWNSWYYSDTYDNAKLANNMIDWLSTNDKRTQQISFEQVYPTSGKTSEIIEGGRAVRYYRLVDDNNIKLNEYKVEYTFTEANETYSALSDENGIVEIVSPNVEKGNEQFTILPANPAFSFKGDIDFTVKTKPVDFMQSYTLAVGAEGSVGLSEGVKGRIGPMKAQVGYSQSLTAQKGAVLNLKYFMNNGTYDLVYGADKNMNVGVKADGGILGQITDELKVKAAEGEVGASVKQSSGLSYRVDDFPNSDKWSDVANIYATLLATGVATTPSLMNNPIVAQLLHELSKEAKGVNSMLTTRMEGSINGLLSLNVGIEAGQIPLANKNVDFELGVQAVNTSGKATAYAEAIDNSNNEVVLKGGLIKEGEKLDFFRLKGKFGNVGGIFDENILDKPFYSQTEYNVTYNKKKLKQLQYIVTNQENVDSTVMTDDIEQTRYKFTIPESELQHFETWKTMDKLSDMKIPAAASPADELDHLLASGTEGKMLYEQQDARVQKVFLPLMIGLGFGYSAEVGINIEGKSQTYFKEEVGVVERSMDAVYKTAMYDDSTIKGETVELQTFLNDLSAIVGEKLSDLFETIIAIPGQVIDTSAKWVKDQTNALIEPVKNSKVGMFISKLNNNLVSAIQTENGEAVLIGEVYYVGFTNDDEEMVSSLDGEVAQFSITYEDELINMLGLAGKEQKFAIYKWDEQTLKFVRMTTIASALENAVTTELTEAGQYVLAYNELNPTFTDFQVAQDGEQLVGSIVIEEDFEPLSLQMVQLNINGAAVDEADYSYNAATNVLQFTTRDAVIGENELTFNVTIDDVSFSHVETVTFEQALQMNVTPTATIVNPNEVNVAVEAFNQQNVRSMELVYSVNNDEQKSVVLVRKNNEWQAAVTSMASISSFEYVIHVTDKYGYEHTTASQVVKVDASALAPITIVTTNIEGRQLEKNDVITLQMNRYMFDASRLQHIQLQDEQGTYIATTVEAVGNTIKIIPAYALSTLKQYTLTIPKDTIVDNANVGNTKELVYEFTAYAKVDAQKTWSITFNDGYNQASLHEIYVVNGKGEKHPITFRHDSATVVTVIPTTPYVAGETYELVVGKNMRNTNDVKLGKDYTTTFIIK